MLHKSANRSRNTPASGRNRHGWRIAAALAIATLLPVFEPAAAETLEEQLRLQQELLQRLGGEDPELPAAPPTPGDAQLSRTAPRTPIDRDYPPAIFEESRVVVSPGEWGNRDRRIMVRRVLDADRDGKPELQRWLDPESKFLVRQVEDRNYDGVQDTWSDYEWGAVASRVLDSNDDGRPDTWERYDKGYMTSREIDRDEDGVRDAFYTYVGDSLSEERHDANNDGKVDLVIVYERRRRVRSEEDVDRDGRFDTRTFFASGAGPEIAVRIERDTRGRGTSDIVEFFETDTGSAIIGRREEDVDGDGDVDIISVYNVGILIRREIYDPAVAVAD